MSPTNFPTALDTTTQLPNTRADATTSATNHKNDHNNLADAVIAVETELGVNPSGASATVAARIDVVAAASVALAPATSARNTIQPTSAAVTPLTVKGAASQTADLQQWQDSAGAVLAAMDFEGWILPAGIVSKYNQLGEVTFGAALIDLGWAADNPGAQTPLIDFHYSPAGTWTGQDYNVRLVNGVDKELLVTAGSGSVRLKVEGEVEVGGALNHDGTTVGFYGVAPVARAAAIASPTSDTIGTKAAIDAIRVALTNLGLTS